MSKHSAFKGKHGGKTNKKITSILGLPNIDPNSEEIFLKHCKKNDIKPADKQREYWIINDDLETHDPQSNHPDEFHKHIEGKSKKVSVNKYERDRKARDKCILQYGCKCSICRFNFKSFYGTIGYNFIHVHHIVPISKVDNEYQVDPILDLRPVCPNCHAMLHKNDPPFKIEELKEIINKNNP